MTYQYQACSPRRIHLYFNLFSSMHNPIRPLHHSNSQPIGSLQETNSIQVGSLESEKSQPIGSPHKSNSRPIGSVGNLNPQPVGSHQNSKTLKSKPIIFDGTHTSHTLKHSDGHDVTLVTQLQYNRLSSFKRLMDAWEGPIQVVMYLSDAEAKQLRERLKSGRLQRANVWYHVVYKRQVLIKRP